jgi:hypothetical protein
LNDDINNKIKLLSAQGGKEKEIYDLRRKQIENELALIQETSKVKGELTDEEQKRQKELLTENAVEAANFYKFTAEQEKAAAEKSKAAAEKAKAEADKRRALELEAQGILEDSRVELLEEREQQEEAVRKEFEAKRKKLKEAGIEDDGNLEKARLARLAEIDKQYKEEAESQEADFQKRLNDIRTEIRLAGIKDENEKARQQILLDFESKRQDVLANEKLTADQRTALILALKDQENQQLKDLQFSIDEANAVRELEKLDAQMKEAEKDFNFQKSLLDQKQALLDKQYEDDLISQEKYNEATKANSNARKEIDRAEYEFKISQAQAAANVLGALSDLAGKQTAAGKALGISQALINTYVGVSDVLQAKSVLPSPFDVIAKVANVATILATGLKAVKAITAVKVPGGGGGGGGVSAPSISATAPTVSSSVPTLGTSPVTALNTAMQQQPPVRAYVVESEVTGSQKRVADIERRAGF